MCVCVCVWERENELISFSLWGYTFFSWPLNHVFRRHQIYIYIYNFLVKRKHHVSNHYVPNSVTDRILWGDTNHIVLLCAVHMLIMSGSVNQPGRDRRTSGQATFAFLKILHVAPNRKTRIEIKSRLPYIFYSKRSFFCFYVPQK